ncbi:hypothetical protein BpHYR1_031672, partial [Brachionus plicatilis]
MTNIFISKFQIQTFYQRKVGMPHVLFKSISLRTLATRFLAQFDCLSLPCAKSTALFSIKLPGIDLNLYSLYSFTPLFECMTQIASLVLFLLGEPSLLSCNAKKNRFCFCSVSLAYCHAMLKRIASKISQFLWARTRFLTIYSFSFGSVSLANCNAMLKRIASTISQYLWARTRFLTIST